jgi:exodeoxyribonuclease VII large subunit
LQEQLRRLRLDRQLQREIQLIDWMRQRLIQSTTQQVQQATQHCRLLRQTLNTLDPKAVLQRGYAVVRQKQTMIVRSTDHLQLGQSLSIHLAQGSVDVEVTAIHPSQSYESSS